MGWFNVLYCFCEAFHTPIIHKPLKSTRPCIHSNNAVTSPLSCDKHGLICMISCMAGHTNMSEAKKTVKLFPHIVTFSITLTYNLIFAFKCSSWTGEDEIHKYTAPSFSLSLSKIPSVFLTRSVSISVYFTILIFLLAAGFSFEYLCDCEFWLWQYCGAHNSTAKSFVGFSH